MSIIHKHIAFVKAQAEAQGRLAAKYSHVPPRQQRHLETQANLQALLQDLLEADKALDARQQPQARAVNSLTLTPEDIEGLPQELIEELSISDGDRTDFAILSVINEAGGMLTLDKILIGLYKKTKEVMKRVTMTSRLYRMSQKGLIYNVPNKKGVYSTRPITDEEANELVQ